MDVENPLGKACRNCGAELSGEWCSACGERRWRACDRSLGALAREANTIASKSPDAIISRNAVEIKGAIDRIKEQVQNIE